MKLSQEHLEAVGRRRRIIFQDDLLATRAFRKGDISPERWNRIVDLSPEAKEQLGVYLLHAAQKKPHDG